MADPRVLLTVSGSIPEGLDDEVAAGRRPRPDYGVLAAQLKAEIVDVSIARRRHGRLGSLLQRIGGPGLLLAWYAVRERRRFDVLVTDGEQVGIPYALLSRLFGSGGLRHAMIVHVITVPIKLRLMRWGRLADRIDRYLVYSSRQGEVLRDDLGVDQQRVVLTPFMVDAAFFSLDQTEELQRDMICSAGLERRDYPTLMRAIEGLEVEVVIAAASPWSKQPDSTSGSVIPSNVRIERLDHFELRKLYAASRLVVMPLVDVDFQAGITAILEAMSMERPVVCSRTSGQTDTIVDGETGIYVSPGDPGELRQAIRGLLQQPEERERIGQRSRDWVLENADVERYADRIASVVAELAGS